jgi:hypothetical protein
MTGKMFTRRSEHNPDHQVKGDFFNRNITIFCGAEQPALVRTLKFNLLLQ